MTQLYATQYPLQPYDAMQASVIVNDVFGVAINWFVNRTPLISRTAKLPVGSPTFLFTNDNYRPRSALLSSGFTANGTSLVFADATLFDVGDVLKCGSEAFLVTATAAQNSSTTTITVTSGYAGTTSANHSSGASVQLITNSRTGAEINIQGLSREPKAITQYCQTVQHAYQVGGSLATTQNYVSGLGTPLDRDRMLALQNCMDDFESAIYYGLGISYGSGASARAMMYGCANLIVTNNTSSPVNANAYKPSDLIRDTLQASFSSGGNVSLLLVSTDFMQGLSVWGQAIQRIEQGTTVFGTPIDVFEAPFLSGVKIVPAPLLLPGSVFAFTEPELKVRLKRPLFEKPRGSRGDAVEGDMIMEGAVELDNEQHHAYVTGITAYSAS
jgi:Family of unknown function (DUF5309)